MINCLTFQIVKSCIVVLTVGMNDGKKDAVVYRYLTIIAGFSQFNLFTYINKIERANLVIRFGPM
jgi:hypothetical protein